MLNQDIPFTVEEKVAATSGQSTPPPLAPTPAPADWRDDLTPAESRVLHHLLTGATNKTIAESIGRSEATIKNQIAAIYQKSGIHNRAKVVAEWNRLVHGP
jgi:DNA-binding NarL/FixJ family response regulator